MDALKAWMPPIDGGYLPLYMLSLSLIAVGNSFQNYMTLHYTRRMYNGQFVPNASLPPKTELYDPADATDKLSLAPSSPEPVVAPKGSGDPSSDDQVTPLAARLFGTYTLISAIVRIYASYHLDEPAMYQMALWTYVVAMFHFGTEHFVFRTTHFGKPLFFPFFFATIGITWMAAQYGHYVKA